MEKKLFIYILKLNPQYENAATWSEHTNAIVGEHFEHLKSLAKEGVVKQFGRTAFSAGHPDLFGLCILEADSEDSALEMMLDDPAVREGVMSARLFPYMMFAPE